MPKKLFLINKKSKKNVSKRKVVAIIEMTVI